MSACHDPRSAEPAQEAAHTNRTAESNRSGCGPSAGHHRVSVALAIGLRDIEAWVTPIQSVALAAAA